MRNLPTVNVKITEKEAKILQRILDEYNNKNEDISDERITNNLLYYNFIDAGISDIDCNIIFDSSIDVKTRCEAILHSLAIFSNIDGYNYIREAINFMHNFDKKPILSVVYKHISSINGQKELNVQRSIRHVSEKIHREIDPKVKDVIFRNKNCKITPTILLFSILRILKSCNT